MTRATDPPTQLGFELEHFEFSAADRLEVSGRWFGVRGRRFMRPTLNLRAGGRRRRLIAVLDHKPWAADGEGAWIAAFAWHGEVVKITNARLEVAPDVVLDLPSPGDDAAGAILHPRPVKREEVKPRPAPPPDTSPEPASTASPPADAPSPPVEAASPSIEVASPAAPPQALADAERRLAEERAERERVAAALRDAEARIAALGEHHDAAVERANELVRLEGELAATKEHIERVERDRVTAQERGDAAERRVAAFRERAETAERELAEAGARADAAERGLAEAGARADAAERERAAAGDIAALRRRAETAERELAARRDGPAPAAAADVAALRRRAEAAERDLAAARDRADAAELEAASPRRRPEAPQLRHVLAARGVSSRRERGWGARAVGLVWIAVLLIALVAIVQLVF